MGGVSEVVEELGEVVGWPTIEGGEERVLAGQVSAEV